MRSPEFHSFEEFWPFYVREHQKKKNRLLHFAGTTLAMGCAAAALLTKHRALSLAAPVVGYGLSWVGHFFVEHNKPATFQYPLWSFLGDMRMWALTLKGEMDAEVERVTTSNGVHLDDSGQGQRGYHVAPDPQSIN